MGISGYRRDIDGLRSIAIGSVVLYHAGVQAFPGGFVGVDIFFVISGYLITSGLLREAASDRISITQFYVRRIRRIIPAYFTVVLACLVAGAVLLLPSEYSGLSRSALAASLFAANIDAWSGTSYFSGSAISQPLLHMWSLAVEEQYYLIWPVVLMGFFSLQRRFAFSARWLPRFIVAAILLSLAGSELMLTYSAKTAFYMAPFRAWELLLGSLLAAIRPPRLPGAWAAHALGGLALALMLAPILLLSEASRFPGMSAMAPCLGALLILYRDERYPSFAAQLLSGRFPVGIGLISYSLYLWHWPILSFYWYLEREAPSSAQAFVLVVAMVVISTFSWRYIERPFRNPQRTNHAASPTHAQWLESAKPFRGDRKVLIGGGAALAGAALIAAVIMVGQGLPERLPAAAARVDAMVREPYISQHGCVLSDDFPSDPAKACFGRADTLRGSKVVLWGDSFAGQHVHTVEQALDRPGHPVISVVATGCTPLPGTEQYFGKGRRDERCDRFNLAVFAQLLGRPDIREVIIAGRWSNLYGLPGSEETFDPTARFLLDSRHRERTVGSSLAVMELSLDHVVAALHERGIAVTLLREPPRYARSQKDCIALALWHREPLAAICGMRVGTARASRAAIDQVLDRVQSRHSNLILHDQIAALCAAGFCLGYRDATLMTRDTEHLTRAGSEVALRELLQGTAHTGL